MAFRNIIGQQKVIEILDNSILEDRLSHAYGFCGSMGMGKKTLAKEFSMLLLCTDKQLEGDGPRACLSCQSCNTFLSGANPDYKCVETDEDNIKIDAIRKLQEDISIAPLYGDKKVYLIADAHKMTPQAQNCLLKTLEEPPPYVTIILTVTLFENLLETIRSRVFKLDFLKYTNEEVKRALEQNYDNINNLDFLVTYSDGNIGVALKLIERDDFIIMRDKVWDILNSLSTKNRDKTFEIPSILEGFKDKIDEVLDIFVLFFRDMLLIKFSGNQNLLINTDKKDMIKRNFNNFSIDRLINCIEHIEKVRSGLNSNANFSLAMEYLTLGLLEENI